MTVRATKSEAFRAAVVDAAVRLFLEKGYHGTNIQQVADLLGVTRPTVYHYFPSKETILQAIADDTTFAAQKLASKFQNRQSTGRPIECFNDFVSAYLNLVLIDPAKFRVSEHEVDNLPAESRAGAKEAWRSVHRQFVDLIQSGIDVGAFEATDPKVAAFAIIGLCNWSAWWYRPDGPSSREVIVDMLTQMALRTIRKPQQGFRGGHEVRDAFEQLARVLGYIDTQNVT